MTSLPSVAISIGDPQVWAVTAVALVAAGLLLRAALGPRRKSGCGSCAPKKPAPPPR
jgi:hypothetical protein